MAGDAPDLVELNAAELLREYELSDRLKVFLDILLQENAKVNLVSRETTRAKLFQLSIESLAPLRIQEFAERWISAREYLDIGSGGGLPAVPILLAAPHLHGVLYERRQKKARALMRIIRALGLNAEIRPLDFVHSPLDGRFDIVTVRYVPPKPKLLARIRKVLAPDGLCWHYGHVPNPSETDVWKIATWRYSTDHDQEPQHLTLLSPA